MFVVPGCLFLFAKCTQFYHVNVIIHFWDKPYQKTNFKYHLSTYLLCIWRKILSDFYMPNLIIFHFICLCSLLKWNKKMSVTEAIPSKVFDFASIPLLGFTLVIKLINFDFESHWNTLIFFDKKLYGIRFEYVPWKTVWLNFIYIVWVHFSHKTKKFWFWK